MSENFTEPKTSEGRVKVGQNYFFNDGAQLYLTFQTLYYTLKRLGHNEKIVSCKSKGLSAEKLTTPTTTDNSLSPSIKWYANSNFCFIFKGSCLKQKNATYFPAHRINFLVVYELDIWSRDLNSDFTYSDVTYIYIHTFKLAL